MVTARVLPHEKVPGHVVNVSLADALVPMVWVKQALFWPIEKQGSFQQASEDLIEGLSRLLTEVPTLAGHLSRHGQAGPRDISITLNDDAFIDFATQDASRSKSTPTYEELQNNGFPIERLPKNFFPKESSSPVLEGSSMFCAQLNRITGGAVLVFCFNHVLTDGWSGSEIERLWALHTTDAGEDVAFRRHRNATPDEMIRRQLSTPPAVKQEGRESSELSTITQVFSVEETFSYLHKNLKSFRAAIRRIIFALLKRLVLTGERPEPRSLAIWEFSSKNLAELKQAASDANADTWISTKDALAGLFWSRLVALEQRKTSADDMKSGQTSTCLFSLNIRKRLSHEVPDEYIGNVVASTIARCELIDLSAAGIKGVQCAAQSLRRVNAAWNEASFHASQNAVLSLPPGKAFGLDRDFLFDKRNIHYNDHSAFRSNTLDWGSTLGCVARTRYPNPGLPAGAPTIFVHPKLPDGGLEVSLTCTEETRQALDADEVFRRYSTFVCQDALPSRRGIFHFLMTALWLGVSGLGRLYWWREVKDFRARHRG